MGDGSGNPCLYIGSQTQLYGGHNQHEQRLIARLSESLAVGFSPQRVYLDFSARFLLDYCVCLELIVCVTSFIIFPQLEASDGGDGDRECAELYARPDQ
jgi:hypothetical protein